MKKQTIFFQCELSQGTLRDIAWIPERGAVIGASVVIENEDGEKEWWKVESVSSTGITEDELNKLQTHARKGFASTPGV